VKEKTGEGNCCPETRKSMRTNNTLDPDKTRSKKKKKQAKKQVLSKTRCQRPEEKLNFGPKI
jgi:hypothetical protein